MTSSTGCYGCGGGGFFPDFSTSFVVVVVEVPSGVLTVVFFVAVDLSLHPIAVKPSRPAINAALTNRFMVQSL